MNLWNRKDLSQPAIITYKTTNQDIDIKHLYNVCHEVKSFFDDNNYLRTEHAVLSRIIYRMKMKFRSAKDFKAVEKLKKALDNFFQINLSASLENFMNLIPSKYRSENYLPTKNLLDYILIRMQGMVKLFERVVETCKIAAHLLEERLHIGHFWKIAFILFALVSRIYILAKFSTNRICEYYGKLRPFSKKLKNTGKDLLPVNYNLPSELKEWLNVEWLEYDDDVQIVEEVEKLPDIFDFFDLVDDEDVEFCDEYFLLDDDKVDDEVKLVNDWQQHKNKKNSVEIEPQGLVDDVIDEIIDITKTLTPAENADKPAAVINHKNKQSGDKLRALIRGFGEPDIGEVIELDDTIVTLSDESDHPSTSSLENHSKGKLFCDTGHKIKLNSESTNDDTIFICDTNMKKNVKQKLKRSTMIKRMKEVTKEVFGSNTSHTELNRKIIKKNLGKQSGNISDLLNYKQHRGEAITEVINKKKPKKKQRYWQAMETLLNSEKARDTKQNTAVSETTLNNSQMYNGNKKKRKLLQENQHVDKPMTLKRVADTDLLYQNKKIKFDQNTSGKLSKSQRKKMKKNQRKARNS